MWSVPAAICLNEPGVCIYECRGPGCRFEWRDGPLTVAAEAGAWLLLESANLCSPAVLDRLNSLLEPSGSILLNEVGSLEGQPRLLTPHPVRLHSFCTSCWSSQGHVGRPCLVLCLSKHAQLQGSLLRNV